MQCDYCDVGCEAVRHEEECMEDHLEMTKCKLTAAQEEQASTKEDLKL